MILFLSIDQIKANWDSIITDSDNPSLAATPAEFIKECKEKTVIIRGAEIVVSSGPLEISGDGFREFNNYLGKKAEQVSTPISEPAGRASEGKAYQE